MKEVKKPRFDFFFAGKDFTTQSNLIGGGKIDDLFFIDGQLVGKQECKNGKVKWFLAEEDND